MSINSSIISHLLTKTGTLKHYSSTGETDSLGNPIHESIETEIKGYVEYVSGNLSINGAIYSSKMYIEPDVIVSEDDTVLLEDKLYWVNSVSKYESPNNTISFQELYLRETLERQYYNGTELQ